MTLEISDSFHGLHICSRCGWPVAGPYEEKRHADCPHVEAGASASALAARLDELPSTKYGYGTGQLAFELDENLSVQLECDKNGTFKLRTLWLIDNLTADETADLVRTIAAWRHDCKEMKRR